MVKKIRKVSWEIVLLLMTLPILIPFYMLVVNSFKTSAEAAEMSLKLPTVWNGLENYSEMARVSNIWVGYKNSFIITAVSVVIMVGLCAITAFIIQRRRQKYSGWLYNFFILGMVLPSFIVPTVVLVRTLHLPGMAGLILIYIAMGLPMGIFLYTGYFKSIPRELDESAILDGCGLGGLFFKIIMPLVTPITATYSIISVLTLWNNFDTPLYLLSGSANVTVTLAMFNFFGPHSADWNLVFACVVATTLPVVLVYLILQKYIIAGMVGGAVKG